MGGPGGLGAGRLGIRLLLPRECFIAVGFGPGVLRGIGGGARGFSKLPSEFCGNRGLSGGLIIGVVVKLDVDNVGLVGP